MSDLSFFSLVAVGGAALFGLHGSLIIAIKHLSLRKIYQNSNCDKVALLKRTHTSNFPTACAAVIFYLMVLLILIGGIYQNEIQIFLLNTVMIIAVFSTGYYILKMHFRSRVFCIDCIRVHLANLMMSFAILFYNFN